MKKSFWSTLVAMFTLVAMAANAQDSDSIIVVDDSIMVIEKVRSSVKFSAPSLEYNEKKRLIKDGKSTQISVNAKYIATADALERYAARFFFRDTISTSLGEAVDCYIPTLGDVDENGTGIADATEKYVISAFSKEEDLWYSYILSYEKVADGKKRTNRRTVTYDVIQNRILQLEDVASASVAAAIRADAGKFFVSIVAGAYGATISYKSQKKLKEIVLSFKKDKEKFAPGFYETLTTINKKKDVAEIDEVDDMPEFPGGVSELVKYLNTNIKYPKQAKENGIRGWVICSFVVEKDGSITNVKVQKSLDPLLDAEAVRVLSAMPKWKPGLQDGKPVRVHYTMPLSFNLQ